MLHWGFLGTAGALTSVLNGLRDSDEVEVGNTRGVQLLRRTILGASLGFVAGFFDCLDSGRRPHHRWSRGTKNGKA